MKRLLKVLTAFFLLVSIANATSAQIYVHIRPHAPRVVRVAAPSPKHVWVNEDWRYENGHYISNGGHWVEPPVGNTKWIPGHWKNTPRRGWVWKPGHWM